MYQCLPSFVISFHGCNKTTGEKILSGDTAQKFSENPYDWLGHGLYFWENDLRRAESWAEEQCKTPFVIGAVIDLGKCLNLLQNDALARLTPAYDHLRGLYTQSTYKKFPQNKGKGTDKLVRNLDCAVIETLHLLSDSLKEQPYDTVRGVFFEGDDLYPDAGFKEKNHIQICVRNRNCIKGYFLPRKKDIDSYPDLVHLITH